ncbi:MAG: hypothetical protein A2202_00185 [Bdellovibrionales bacterium RIFOXYA1_FULL_36_14]|nr:MAG: hypothetical protein A2202_00185 [Bdellovibrionales bacterium RIFOXYA1_FULL_36_14]
MKILSIISSLSLILFITSCVPDANKKCKDGQVLVNGTCVVKEQHIIVEPTPTPAPTIIPTLVPTIIPTPTIQPKLSCGSIPHNGTESRIAYSATSVAYGQSCSSIQQTQTRTCNNGVWSAWSGSYQYLTCSVQAALACGTIASGAFEVRTMYQTAAVNEGQTCVSEIQNRKCTNGQFGSWSGTYTQSRCVISRIRYESATINAGETCKSQNQIMTCENAICGVWTPNNYLYPTCTLVSSNTGSNKTSITAQVIRNQAGSGETFISSGFPFPPGLVSESAISSGTIQVFVEGVEIAANVSALRGRHHDGSIRSVLIQFKIPHMTQGDVLTAQVIVGGAVRSMPDPAYQRPTLNTVLNNNILFPTNPSYITSTQITFQHLLPFGQGTSSEEKQYTTLANDRFDALVISDNSGTARYEEVRAMITLWARSGNIKYFNKAVSQSVEWLDYSTPGAAGEPVCKADKYVNPDGRILSNEKNCGLAAEWQFARVFSYASMYLLTGYRDYWAIVAYNASFQQYGISDQTLADKNVIGFSQYDLPRFNYAQHYGSMIAALMIDATMPISGQWFGARKYNWKDQLEWTLNAIKTNEWNFQWLPFNAGAGTVPPAGTIINQGTVSAQLLGIYLAKHDPQVFAGQSMPISGYMQVNNISGGTFKVGALSGLTAYATGPNESDYRQGMTGVRSNSPRGVNLGTDTVIPVFQLTFPSHFLIDYYLMVNADSRIPLMVKRNLDIVLKQIRPLSTVINGGQWGNPVYGNSYVLKNPVDMIGKANPYELPEYARMLAFVIRTIGDDTVNGASYSTWYNRLIDTANNSPIGVLIWQWKLFGQFYGFGADTPWMMSQKSLVGTVGMRIPINYTDIPRDIPDLQRK